MQFPEPWLREFCTPPLSTQQLADLLTMSGMEVEDQRPVAPPFSGIVVAEILTAEQHPSADRLRELHEHQFAGTPDTEISARIANYELAFNLQTSVPEVTDLKDEPAHVVDSYGPAAPKPASFAATCARTTPASVLRSAMPMAASPR